MKVLFLYLIVNQLTIMSVNYFDLLDTPSIQYIAEYVGIDDYLNLIETNKYLQYCLNIDSNKNLYNRIIENNIVKTADGRSFIQYRGREILHGINTRWSMEMVETIIVYSKGKLTRSIIYDNIGRCTIIYIDGNLIKLKHDNNGNIRIKYNGYVWKYKNNKLIPSKYTWKSDTKKTKATADYDIGDNGSIKPGVITNVIHVLGNHEIIITPSNIVQNMLAIDIYANKVLNVLTQLNIKLNYHGYTYHNNELYKTYDRYGNIKYDYRGSTVFKYNGGNLVKTQTIVNENNYFIVYHKYNRTKIYEYGNIIIESKYNNYKYNCIDKGYFIKHIYEYNNVVYKHTRKIPELGGRVVYIRKKINGGKSIDITEEEYNNIVNPTFGW